jgi:phage virion morphogenesis protein
MIEAKFEDEGIKQALKNLAERGANLRPVMRQASAIMLKSVLENFRDQGRPNWTDLAESTKKQRARQGHWPGQILNIHAAGLMHSIQAHADENSAVVGTNKSYAAIQHFGGTINMPERSGTLRLRTTATASGDLLRQAGHSNLAVFASKRHKRFIEKKYTAGEHEITIPARPFLVLDEDSKKEILNVLAKHLAADYNTLEGFQNIDR